MAKVKSQAAATRAFKEYRVTWTGLKPLVMHNIQLANPFNPITRRVAELVKLCKKDPTEENQKALIHTEWLGGLYLDKEQRPVVMSNAIRACIAAKSFPTLRGGKDAAKAAITVYDCPLVQHGERGCVTAKDFWERSEREDGRFLLYVPVTVNNNVVMRSRPMFPEWSITFDMTVNTGVIDDDMLRKLMDMAGDNGLYDYRPDYGQFEATLEAV
jgi:hypothetical protein